jgi:hypothetical protein
VNRLKRRLRWYLNREIVEQLHAIRVMIDLEIARARGWDGVPAPLVARREMLLHVLEILGKDL